MNTLHEKLPARCGDIFCFYLDGRFLKSDRRGKQKNRLVPENPERPAQQNKKLLLTTTFTET